MGTSRTNSGRWSASTLSDLRKGIPSVRAVSDPVAAFGAFAMLEARIEPIEDVVYGAAAALDEATQAQVDFLRGK